MMTVTGSSYCANCGFFDNGRTKKPKTRDGTPRKVLKEQKLGNLNFVKQHWRVK